MKVLFTDVETDAQRESVNCPKAHSAVRAEMGFESVDV